MKKILLILAAILAIGGGAGYVAANQNESKSVISAQQEVKGEVSYKGIDGRSALELLKNNYKVETEEYPGIGEMVKSIEGTSPKSDQFWAFYVNGEPAQVGAGAYVTKPTDTITWKLDTIQ